LQRPHQLSLDPFCSDRSIRSGFSQLHFSFLMLRMLGAAPDGAMMAGRSPGHDGGRTRKVTDPFTKL